MQITRPNCEGCEGSTRQACNAVYEKVRSVGESTTIASTKIADDDIIGIMNYQEKAAEEFTQVGSETRVSLEALGCTLNEVQLQAAFIHEISTGVYLALTAIEEEVAEEERQRTERIQKLLDESSTTLAAISESTERIQRILDEGEPLVQEVVRQATEDASQEAEDFSTMIATSYCVQQGWDINNLGLAESMELMSHLRTMGCIR